MNCIALSMTHPLKMNRRIASDPDKHLAMKYDHNKCANAKLDRVLAVKNECI